MSLKTQDVFASNNMARKLIKDNHKELIRWIKKLPYYYETDKQIFVHAGIYEGEGEYWKICTSEDEMCWMRPCETGKGKFYKDVIAGHTGTYAISGDKHFHDIYFDGGSHYYIDGTVYVSKKLPVLVYDSDTDKYFQAVDKGLIPILPHVNI